MSGGHFESGLSYSIESVIESLDEDIASNDLDGKDEYGSDLGNGFTEETIKIMKEGRKSIAIAAVYIRRLDYLLAGDDGEASFVARLNEELKDLES